MKKLFVVLLSIIAVMSACKKFDFEENEEVGLSEEKTTLYVSNGGQKSNEIVRSNDTVYGVIDYYFKFHLSPNTSIGNFSITDSVGSMVFNSASNSIDWKALYTGVYKLNVLGKNFNYTNITIIVTSSGTINPPNPGPYAGPRLYNLVVGDSTVSVNVAVTKAEYKNSAYPWFWLYRTNRLNFITKLPLTTGTDSVFFTITFPRISGTIIEFNTGINDGSVGGIWLTPSAYSGPLPGSNGNPYSYSGSYFGFKFIIGNNFEIQSIGGTTILSVSNNLPGSAGDDYINHYRVRWTGNNYYLRTSATDFRYKVGNGSWNYISLTTLSTNSNYMTCTFPSGISGQVSFQWGVGASDATFKSWTLEMSESKFYISSLDCCVQNF